MRECFELGAAAEQQPPQVALGAAADGSEGPPAARAGGRSGGLGAGARPRAASDRGAEHAAVEAGDKHSSHNAVGGTSSPCFAKSRPEDREDRERVGPRPAAEAAAASHEWEWEAGGTAVPTAAAAAGCGSCEGGTEEARRDGGCLPTRRRKTSEERRQMHLARWQQKAAELAAGSRRSGSCGGGDDSACGPGWPHSLRRRASTSVILGAQVGCARRGSAVF
jgi:hypothetical protein